LRRSKGPSPNRVSDNVLTSYEKEFVVKKKNGLRGLWIEEIAEEYEKQK